MDRLLTQMRLAGKLDQAAGIVFGECSRCTPKDYKPGFDNNLSLGEVVDEILGKLKIPVLSGLTIGHTADQLTLPMGVMATLDADKGTLTIEEAAAKVHVSPAAFSRFFRRSLGKTFTEYVNDLRCTEAAIQLRKTDKPVATVAHDCGFTTLSHFNRQFLLRHGQTPRLYRKAT